jgi:hypothetical protein
VLEAEGEEAWLNKAERWIHRDLPTPAEKAAFTTAALTYRIFCKSPPYPQDDIETLRQDIREGVFTPPALAAEGLEDGLCSLIAACLDTAASYAKPNRKDRRTKRPSLEELYRALGSPGSASVEGYFHPLSEAEKKKLTAERDQFNKRIGRSVKTKRFVYRNTAIIGGITAAVIITGLLAYSIIKGNLEKPNTRGLSPEQVVETYYGAFNTLDHGLMEAAVTNKAGKEDINMITNILVLTRMRQAYEFSEEFISPQEWVEQGSPPTAIPVFGISELEARAKDQDETDDEVSFQVSYLFWDLETFTQESAGDNFGSPETTVIAPIIPQGTAVIDEVTLTRHKGAWRISEIKRH